jgi:hypothetical protein
MIVGTVGPSPQADSRSPVLFTTEASCLNVCDARGSRGFRPGWPPSLHGGHPFASSVCSRFPLRPPQSDRFGARRHRQSGTGLLRMLRAGRGFTRPLRLGRRSSSTPMLNEGEASRKMANEPHEPRRGSSVRRLRGEERHAPDRRSSEPGRRLESCGARRFWLGRRMGETPVGGPQTTTEFSAAIVVLDLAPIGWGQPPGEVAR